MERLSQQCTICYSCVCDNCRGKKTITNKFLVKTTTSLLKGVNERLFTRVNAVKSRRGSAYVASSGCRDHVGGPRLARQIAGHCGAEAGLSLAASRRSGKSSSKYRQEGEERCERSLRGKEKGKINNLPTHCKLCCAWPQSSQPVTSYEHGAGGSHEHGRRRGRPGNFGV